MKGVSAAFAAYVETRQRGILICAISLTALVAVVDIFAMAKLNALTMLLFMGAQAVLGLAVLLYLVLVLSTRESITRRHFAPGEVIFRQGDSGREVYVIVNGEVEIVREGPGQARIAKLRPGEFFGEMALIMNAPRVATARAGSSLDVLVLNRATFASLFTSLPALRQNFQEVMAERVAAAQPGE
jgi:CRP-like cAMP-binding protein